MYKIIKQERRPNGFFWISNGRYDALATGIEHDNFKLEDGMAMNMKIHSVEFDGSYKGTRTPIYKCTASKIIPYRNTEEFVNHARSENYELHIILNHQELIDILHDMTFISSNLDMFSNKLRKAWKEQVLDNVK